MNIRLCVAVATVALSVGATGAAPDDADALATRACTSPDLAPSKPMAAADLKQRLAALGVRLSDKDNETIDNSCKITAMMHFAAVPLLSLATKDGKAVQMTVQIDHQGGAECEAIVIGLQGC